MGKYKTNQKVIRDFDQMTNEVQDTADRFYQAVTVLTDLFTTGLEYKDENGNVKISEGLLRADAPKQLVEDLFGKGSSTLGEITNLDGLKQCITWFCISEGVTLDEIINLSTKPDAPETQGLKDRLTGMREKFRTLVTSNDPEQLASFFMNTFKAFSNEIPPLLEGDTFETVKNHTVQCLVMAGAGDLLQKSLENNDAVSNDTQLRLIDTLNTQIRAEFGPDSSLRDVIATLQPFHALNHCLDQINGEEKSPETRMKMMNSLRDFHILKSVNEQCQAEGRLLNVFSSEMGKAATINMNGYPGFDISDHNIINGETSEPVISEMKAFLGDNTGVTLYNDAHLNDFSHNLVKNSAISVGPDTAAKKAFFSLEDFEKSYMDLKDGDIDAVVTKKMKNGTPLTKAEILAFLSHDNPACSDADRELVDMIMDSADRVSRGEAIDVPLPGDLGSNLSYVMNAMVQSVFHKNLTELGADKHMTAEDFRRATDNLQYFRGFSDDKIDMALPEDEFHMKNMNELTALYNKAGRTVFSSDKFKNLSEAFGNLKTPDNRKEDEYRAQLEALRKAAEEYLESKKADGKTIRRTQRGRDRMEFARRALEFTTTTLKGMDEMTESMAAEQAKNALQKSEGNAQRIRGRIDDIFGPKVKGNKAMVRAKVYKEDSFDAKDMQIPENCPFNDHEIALIGFVNLTDGAFLRGTRRDNTFMNDTELGESMRVHSTSDIFVSFRSGADTIVQRFGAMREKAETYIREYMNGNTKPLAEAIGNNIRATVRNLMSSENLTDTIRGDIICLSETATLLREHPELMQDCGLSEREKTEVRFFERIGTMIDQKNTALEKLQDKMLPEEEVQKAFGDIFAFELARTDFVNGRKQSDNTPEYLQIAGECMNMISESSVASGKLNRLIADKASEEQIQAARTEFNNAEMKKNLSQFRMENASADRPLSPMIQFIGGTGSLQSKVNHLTEELMKTDAFKQISPESAPSKVISAAIKEMAGKQSEIVAPQNNANQERTVEAVKQPNRGAI